MTDAQLTGETIGAAIEVHRSLGPGLLESAYEQCLALRSIRFERQKPLPLVHNDVEPDCGYRIDLLVDGRVVIELKAVDSPAPVHEAIVLTYLRLSGRLHTAILRDGIQRLVNNYAD